MLTERGETVGKYELMPCPFCGGKAKLEVNHRAFINAETTRVALVRCMDCNARSGRVELSKYGKTNHCREANDIVVELWNKRV